MEYKTKPIDLIAPLKALKHRAEGLHESPFRDGYLMAIQHAIELNEVQQIRLEGQLNLKELERSSSDYDPALEEDRAEDELNRQEASWQTQDRERQR